MSATDFTTYVPPVGTSLTTTGLTTVYTAQDTYANVASIWIANRTGSPVPVTVDWFDSDVAATFSLCFQSPVAANGFLVLEPKGFSLDKLDEIRATAGSANALHCIVSPVQIAGRSA